MIKFVGRFGATVVLAACLAGPAQADVIAGHWCAPDNARNVVITPDNAVSYNGTAVRAEVTRHHVEFTLPDRVPDAGALFTGNQVSDNQISVKIGKAAAEAWTPCKPVS